MMPFANNKYMTLFLQDVCQTFFAVTKKVQKVVCRPIILNFSEICENLKSNYFVMVREISPSTTLQSLQIVAVKLSILAILPKL